MQNIVLARQQFADLEAVRLPEVADDIVSLMRDCLNAEKVDVSALDPSGKSTRAEIEKRIMSSLTTNYIMHAYNIFIDLESTHHAKNADSLLNNMDRALKKAKTDASALDLFGISTRIQMEQRVKGAWDKNRKLNPTLKSLEETRRIAAMAELLIPNSIVGNSSLYSPPGRSHLAHSFKQAASIYTPGSLSSQPFDAHVTAKNITGLPANNGEATSDTRKSPSRSKRMEQHMLARLIRKIVKKGHASA